MASFSLVVACVLLAIASTFAQDCGEGCAQTWDLCGGKKLESKLIACCKESDQCVFKSEWYSQCRPKASPLPNWANATVVACGNPVDADASVAAVPTAAKPLPATAVAPVAAPVSSSIPPPPPPPTESCGAAYKAGEKFTSDCGKDCAVPFVADAVSADSEEACLDACDPAQGCHCALFWASINQCSLKWTPCNSAMLNLAPNANGAVVVQPCITYPIAVKPQSAIGSCGAGQPMRQYPGWMITKAACTEPACTSNTTTAASIDACTSACVTAGYEKCKSVQYIDAEAFGLVAGECTMYSARLEYMGAHAATEVLQVAGTKPAAVAASYCSAPVGHAKYPTNKRSDFGVDWDAVCAGGKDMTTVPDMQMGCDNCAFIPENREDVESPYDADFFHFKSDTIEDCMADCKANDECGCAFWRPHDRKPFGYCALTNSECSDPTIGAQIDYTRIRTAIVKCGYSASASVQEGWPEETYDGIDWFGIWDDVCQQPGSYTYSKMTTYCGPGCVLKGTSTIKAADEAECAKYCKDTTGCYCSYYSTSSSACSLMTEEGGACTNFPSDPDALAYTTQPASQNDVTVHCGDFEHLDPAYYYD